MEEVSIFTQSDVSRPLKNNVIKCKRFKGNTNDCSTFMPILNDLKDDYAEKAKYKKEKAIEKAKKLDCSTTTL